MEPLHRSRWSVAGTTVALVSIAMLGNLRLQASEVGVDALPVQSATFAHSPLVAVEATRRVDSDDDGESVDQASSPDVADEPGRLVPAIYAWDPDVRFVYYRHVSKWM